MKRFLKPQIIVLLAFVGLLTVGLGGFFVKKQVTDNQQLVKEVAAQEPYRIVSVPIKDNDTFGSLMKDAGIDYADVSAIVAAAEDAYSVTKIRVGKELKLYFDKDTDEFVKMAYRIGTEDDLVASREVRNPKSEDGNPEFGILNSEKTTSSTDETVQEYIWKAERVPIPYEIRVQTASATVDSILYISAIEQGMDELLILDLAQAFQWQVDFAMDVRQGDTVKVIYEARYLDGQYVMPGQILAARYVNQGQNYDIYYFEESADNMGFFDPDGNSVQRMFLKAPVEFRYISSGFTTGLRYISAFDIATGHRAIDYAASLGTPIRAVGDGTVTYAGWNRQGYGNLVSIRHNGTYSTNYGHQSKIIVKVGQKVKQGQTIGYVGSTGLSTGPHLHYEMVKNGVKINPFNEILPPGKPIKEESRAAFQAVLDKFKPQLEG